MKTIAVIPSRYESSRFPGKPLADICGKPMIWWVYNQVKKVSEFSQVIVATDDDRIVNECKKYGMEVLLTSKEHQTGTDRLGEVAKKLDADFYVNIQGDEPLIEPATIEKIIEFHKQFPKIEVINSMTKLSEDEDVNCNTIVKVVSADNGDLLLLSRAAVPYSKKGNVIQYYKHLGLYGLSRDALLFFANAERTKNEKIEDVEMLRFLENGYRIKIVEVESRTIAVDVPGDVERVIKCLENGGKR